jgi:HAD superfamily hydrolase (TIGR01484 family)
MIYALTIKNTMRYHVLATDYDGTIAWQGKVDNETIEALQKCKASSRKLILVTGRELDELLTIFPKYDLFDLIVAENGAIIFDPASKEEILLGEKPPENFINELKQKNVTPLSVGRVIVATWEPYEAMVLQAIHNAGIEYQVIFNKGAVMVLPPGINKATGLQEALDRLKISMHNVVAIGDAENDQAMFRIAECSAAVGNALVSIKKEATIITQKDHGAGVAELIASLIENDLAFADERLTESRLVIGKKGDHDFSLSAYRNGILLAGSSGGGKSTLTTAFIEALVETKHQFCIIDPEGDYMDFPNAVVIGDGDHEPVIYEVMALLENVAQNIVVCLLGIPLDRRPFFFNEFIAKFNAVKNNTGHPHWLIIDECNHLVPAEMEDSFFNIPDNLMSVWLISTEARNINRSILKYVDTVIAIGDEDAQILSGFAQIKDLSNKFSEVHGLPKGGAWVWEITQAAPLAIETRKPEHLSKRHIRKYATGDMMYSAFIFKGPENKLNLKANNALMFVQMAEGVDDETWNFHLQRHDYTTWFADSLHDDELAQLAKGIENTQTTAATSKDKILTLVRARYIA